MMVQVSKVASKQLLPKKIKVLADSAGLSIEAVFVPVQFSVSNMKRCSTNISC